MRVDPFNSAFAAIRNVVPNDVKAVNMYQRQLPGVDRFEISMAFHLSHATSQDALDGAMRGDFVRGVTFARGLPGHDPRAWLVADAFESE